MNEILQKEEDEISLADLFREMNQWIKLFRNNFLLIFSLAMLVGGLGYINAFYAKPTYNASLKFIMKSDANGLSSSLSSLSSLLGGSSSGGSTTEQLIALAGTDRIIGYALLKSVKINNQTDLLINHYISIENLKYKWQGDTVLNKVLFTGNDLFETINYAQRKALKKITATIAGPQATMFTTTFDKKSAVITITVVYTNEPFGIELVNAVYKELLNFYFDQTIYKTNINIQILTKKVDSIRNALAETQHNFAKNIDQSLGILLQKDKVENKSLGIKEQMLVLMYGEAQKNLEAVKFMQASTIPSFAIIETPYAPIEPIRKSKIQYFLLGLLSSIFVSIVFLRIKLFWKTKIRPTLKEMDKPE